MSPPVLPQIAGANWRPLTPDDAGAMADLQQACFLVDGGYRITPTEMREEFDRHGEHAQSDSIGAFAHDGRLLALGWCQVPPGGVTERRGIMWMLVHPDVRGAVEDLLFAWIEFVGRERLLASGDDVALGLYCYEIYESMSDMIALMQRHGFERVRYFTENIRDLSEPIDDAGLDEGLVVRSWSDRVGADALIVHNAAFVDHWGSQPIEPHMWASYNSNEFFLPRASWVVYDGDAPVAYVKSAKFPHDFEDRDRTESWIEGIGTVRSHRGRGLASYLITRAMSAFRDDGMEFACLGVDSENPTGANSIYERLGFVVEKRTLTFRKSVP